MNYTPGQPLRLNEEGLKHISGGDKKGMERLKKWRFIFQKMSKELDHWGNPCLIVERIGLRGRSLEKYSPRFLEPDEKGGL